MNNLTNKLLTKVSDLAQTSGGILNVADKLISRFLASENAAAFPCFYLCQRCVNRVKRCRTCCYIRPFRVCYPYRSVAC
jgi:hypothetical protein